MTLIFLNHPFQACLGLELVSTRSYSSPGMTISYFCHDTKRRGGEDPRGVIMTLIFKNSLEVSPYTFPPEMISTPSPYLSTQPSFPFHNWGNRYHQVNVFGSTCSQKITVTQAIPLPLVLAIAVKIFPPVVARFGQKLASEAISEYQFENFPLAIDHLE